MAENHINPNSKMSLNSRQHYIYDIVISTLACFSVSFILMDYSGHLTGWKLTCNRLIFIVFLTDYLLRLANARRKLPFFKRNIWDLLALLPFHGIFPPCPVYALDTVLRVCNLLKIGAFLVRPLKKANRFLNTNGFKYVLLATAGLIVTGGVLIHYAEGMDINDGIWWAFVTATTVGYGDISPSTFYGRVIAMILMLVGIGLLGSVTSTLTSFFMERSSNIRSQTPPSMKESTLEMIQTRLSDFDRLTDEDIDEICAILHTLKKGK
ncbi:MAG: potassium channel family protein [Blautia sp.]|nr:potassium channel family protein [Blautia sp.]